MSARIGVPTHRVLGALLDHYTDRLPEAQRRRVEEETEQHSRRPQ